MKKRIIIILLLILFFTLCILIYININTKVDYVFDDNIIDYKNTSEDIILELNETKKLPTENIEVSSDILSLKDNMITAEKLGTTIIKANNKNIKVAVVKNKKIINIKNNLTLALGPIENKNMYMQNFDIDKDKFYISYTNSSYILTKDTCNKKEILDKITKIKILKFKNNKKQSTFTIKDSGHAQSFLYTDGDIWTTGDGYAYKDELNRCWGKGKYLIKIKYEKNQVKDYKDANLIIKFHNYEGKKYYNPEMSIDKNNDLISIKLKDNVLIYNKEDFLNKENKVLYKFKIKTNIEEIYINDNKTYNQGGQLYNGYYYQYLGAPNSDIYIIVYDMLGNIVKTIKYHLKNLGFEAEGIKIYKDQFYIGVTKKDKISYIYILK